MFIVGIIFLTLALALLIFNLNTSYDTHGGALGQVPVFGSTIIQVPMLALIGVSLLEKSGRLPMEWWYYPVIGLAVGVLSGLLVILAGRYGKYRNPHKHWS